MPRTDEQNRLIRDERREQIIRAALKVFARRGMASAKISDIASEAGFSHGLVYHYFKSKEEIFTTLIRRALENSAMLVQHAKRQAGTPMERLQWMTRVMLQNIESEGAYYFLIMIQAFTSDAVPEEVKQLLPEHFLSTLEATLPIIEEGQRAGQIAQGDSFQLAVCYYSLIQGLAVNRFQLNDAPLPDAETVLRIFSPGNSG